MITLELLLIMIALAELARQIVHKSTLSMKIKQGFGLIPDNVQVRKRMSIWYYWSRLRWWTLASLPFVIISIVIHHIWNLISELLDCDRCLSFHLLWLTLYFHFNLDLWTSLLLAPICIIIVILLEKIDRL